MKSDREILQWISGFLQGKLSLTAAEKEILKKVLGYLQEDLIHPGVNAQFLFDQVNRGDKNILNG